MFMRGVSFSRAQMKDLAAAMRDAQRDGHQFNLQVA